MRLAFIFPVMLFSLCVHEYAHAWVATRRGDSTPGDLGRLSMHPMAHADVFGTLILPIFCLYNGWPFIGWAKPVPVNQANMKNKKWDMVWVAAAGPLSNILLATLSAVALGLGVGFANGAEASDAVTPTVLMFLQISLQLNIFLAVFNLLPIPPLDGFMVASHVLPSRYQEKLDAFGRYGFLVILFLFITGGFQYLILGPSQYLIGGLTALAGAIAG